MAWVALDASLATSLSEEAVTRAVTLEGQPTAAPADPPVTQAATRVRGT
jgi:hypothetical protein